MQHDCPSFGTPASSAGHLSSFSAICREKRLQDEKPQAIYSMHFGSLRLRCLRNSYMCTGPSQSRQVYDWRFATLYEANVSPCKILGRLSQLQSPFAQWRHSEGQTWPDTRQGRMLRYGMTAKFQRQYPVFAMDWPQSSQTRHLNPLETNPCKPCTEVTWGFDA